MHQSHLQGPSRELDQEKNQDFMSSRSCGSRFDELNSFDTRRKQLHNLYKQKRDTLKNEMKMEKKKLEAEQEKFLKEILVNTRNFYQIQKIG